MSGPFDRDAHPVRFTLVTSVAGGLSVATIMALVNRTHPADVLSVPVPLWICVVLLAVLAGPVVVVARRIRPREKLVFMMISAFEQKYWLAELVQNTHRSLDREGCDLVLKSPDRDYSSTAQLRHMRRILARPGRFRAGLVVVSDPHAVAHDFTVFCERFVAPVVFVDVEPFPREADYPRNAVYVGYGAGEIGTLAGEYVVRRLEPRATTGAGRILVVGSRSQSGRQSAFVDTVRRHLPHVRVDLDEDGEFTRSRACSVTLRNLRAHESADEPLLAIFCTNDEMAFGAVDALTTVGNPLFSGTFVVGVDGTADARALIESGTSPLVATVEQDSYAVAETAVARMEEILAGKDVRRRTFLPPRIHDGRLARR